MKKLFENNTSKMLLVSVGIIALFLFVAMYFFEYEIDDYFEDSAKQQLIEKTISTEKLISLSQKNNANFSYSDILSDKSFNGYGYYFIINTNGDIIYSSESDYKLCYYENLYQFFQDINDLPDDFTDTFIATLADKTQNLMECKLNDEIRYISFKEIEDSHLTLISVIPFSYINENKKSIAFIFYLLVIIFTVLIIVEFAVIQFFSKSSNFSSQPKILSPYATHQNQSMIFECDFEKQVVEITGDTPFIVGVKITSMSMDAFKKNFDRIHPDDLCVVEDIAKHVQTEQITFSTELRIKCKDEKYYWFRLNGSSVYEKLDSKLKFIGNLLNVNGQTLDELEIKRLSNTDPVSGLLHYDAFDKLIQKSIAKEKTSNTCALFKINLDNFRKLNEKLGHAMGDIALKDTGTKLTMIFSHNDILGRISGDEFQAFLCLDHMISQEDAMDIITSKAESLIETLTETYINDTRSIKITASVGIAVYPYHGTTYKELNHFAETALFSAKQSGKNEFRIYSHGIMDRPIATEY